MSASTHQIPLNQIENIYLTSRIRMTAEVRLKRAGKLINYLITWYSFSLIALSVLDTSKVFNIPNFSVFSIAFSIAILVASLILQGERHQERAERFRECYLKLQGLYRNQSLAPESVIESYQNILDNYENHSEYDYQSTIVSAWWNGKKLNNSSGAITVSCKCAIYVVARKLLSFTLWTFFFSIPFFALIFIN